MRILNLYAGIGGNRKLWEEHEVTAVELEHKIADVYKANFPNDTVIIADAHKYLLDNHDKFDFIWSSPPCQSHTKMMKATRHNVKKYIDLNLYQEIIFLQNFHKGLFVVENVKPYYPPLINPTSEIGRHLFWSNFRITSIDVINHKNFIQGDSPEDIKNMKEWIGINYDGNIYYGDNHSPGQILRNCVHPDTGLHILNCALGKYHDNKSTQPTLF